MQEIYVKSLRKEQEHFFCDGSLLHIPSKLGYILEVNLFFAGSIWASWYVGSCEVPLPYASQVTIVPRLGLLFCCHIQQTQCQNVCRNLFEAEESYNLWGEGAMSKK